MLAAIRSAAVVGIDAYDVIVEVDAAPGLPQWLIVGLPAGAVKESRERVSAALVNSGFTLPPRRITVNLAPADVRKEGSAFDLPIALGILVATGQLESQAVDGRIFVGELSLDGAFRNIRGALSIARHVGRSSPGALLVVPPANHAEAGRVTNISLAAPETLRELVLQLRSDDLVVGRLPEPVGSARVYEVDFADVVGQESAKRALEVAAAGSHNLVLIGPPGAGKTMLARRLPTILPQLSEEEALEVIAIHSVAGVLSDDITLGARPFRAPHHSISGAGLIGGGSTPRPGEVSLAHNGVLFLDEMLEFPRGVLDGLRQPLEDATVVIARAAMSVSFPARFTLVGATNPCPCGRAGEPGRKCTCGPAEVARYAARMSGPLTDRIDMHVPVGAVALRDLSDDSATGDGSAGMRERVARARCAQRMRYRMLRGVTCNAHVPGRWLDRHTPVETDARSLLHSAASALELSARSYHRVLKVARTIADLDSEERICARHVGEALRYRPSVRT
jgi:magnesium chelatase family protein